MFNVGDTVILKSGGPAMTVIGYNYDDHLICNWFDKNQELKNGIFPQHSVEA
ncbi:DUF2158 domain-containing protein, partial [Vibrio anguillarum]|uniref:YodC family protein n=2 Tax=Vibrionaceae TaxID=641 RepID=UPI00188C4203|nr:DUF2158 domain-containing protein [Vibrio anguillarum]